MRKELIALAHSRYSASAEVANAAGS